MFFGAVLAVAAAIEQPLSFRDSPPEDHTHAFDVFCMPFPPETADPVARSVALLADRVPAHAWSPLVVLASIVAAGALLAAVDPGRSIEARLEQNAVAIGQRSGGRALDVTVPTPVLGAVLLGGLVALSVVAAYVYYPDLPTCLEGLRMVETETHSAALAGDKRRTQVWITAWEDLVRRTEVGIWIRRPPPPAPGSVTPEMTTAAETLRERIEALKHAVLDPGQIDREHVAAELKLLLTRVVRIVTPCVPRAQRTVLLAAGLRRRSPLRQLVLLDDRVVISLFGNPPRRERVIESEPALRPKGNLGIRQTAPVEPLEQIWSELGSDDDEFLPPVDAVRQGFAVPRRTVRIGRHEMASGIILQVRPHPAVRATALQVRPCRPSTQAAVVEAIPYEQGC